LTILVRLAINALALVVVSYLLDGVLIAGFGSALVAALVLGVIEVEAVESAASLLLSNLGILFVPPAVGVMLYFDLIAAEWLPLLAGTFGSLLAVLWSTAFVARLFEKAEEQ